MLVYWYMVFVPADQSELYPVGLMFTFHPQQALYYFRINQGLKFGQAKI